MLASLYWDSNVFLGKMKLYAGGQQPNQQMSVGSNILETEFTVNQS